MDSSKVARSELPRARKDDVPDAELISRYEEQFSAAPQISDCEIRLVDTTLTVETALRCAILQAEYLQEIARWLAISVKRFNEILNYHSTITALDLRRHPTGYVLMPKSGGRHRIVLSPHGCAAEVLDRYAKSMATVEHLSYSTAALIVDTLVHELTHQDVPQHQEDDYRFEQTFEANRERLGHIYDQTIGIVAGVLSEADCGYFRALVSHMTQLSEEPADQS
jgi:hypothetical protein